MDEPIRFHNPIKRCLTCGKPIVRQVTYVYGRGKVRRREWSKKLFCSEACRLRDYRKRKKEKI